MLTGTNNIISISCWLGLTTLIIISCDVFYVDWDSQHHHYCMLTRTHNTDYNIMWYISCWLGLTIVSKFHVDSDSQHWIWYHVMHFMLTGNNNIITISCWLGLKTLIILSNDIFYVDWDYTRLLEPNFFHVP